MDGISHSPNTHFPDKMENLEIGAEYCYSMKGTWGGTESTCSEKENKLNEKFAAIPQMTK